AFGVALLGVLLTSRPLRRRAGVGGIADPAVVPLLLLLLSVGSLVSAPVQNTISRAMEAHADRTSLEVTGEYDAFTEMQRQLSVRSLADPTPPAWRQWWFGTHPTTLQRIGMAEAMKRAHEKR
ncbi:MAG TPA: M48 family metalloprotease, partial [Candidatus Limnocylindria bacterium]|nr:M48 family metalloprotease [Candidatus Limnocylindria bacterium]